MENPLGRSGFLDFVIRLLLAEAVLSCRVDLRHLWAAFANDPADLFCTASKCREKPGAFLHCQTILMLANVNRSVVCTMHIFESFSSTVPVVKYTSIKRCNAILVYENKLQFQIGSFCKKKSGFKNNHRHLQTKLYQIQKNN